MVHQEMIIYNVFLNPAITKHPTSKLTTLSGHKEAVEHVAYCKLLVQSYFFWHVSKP